KVIRISLANKCQLLFGLAVVLVMTAALTVVGWRMQTLVERGPERRAQDLAQMWLAGQIAFGEPIKRLDTADPPVETGVVLTLIDADDFVLRAAEDAWIADTVERFEQVPDLTERFEPALDDDGRVYYRYARAVRASEVALMDGAF